VFAVIFEVQPKADRFDEYLEFAKFLKPELEKIDGFIDNERFGSRRIKGRILSLSTWRDEKAVIRWRTLAVHHGVQEKGRFELFEDYHLRVGEIVSDTDVPQGHVLREQRFDVTEVGKAKSVTISELMPVAAGKPKDLDQSVELRVRYPNCEGLAEREVFDSIYSPGKSLLLASWGNAAAADRWRPDVAHAGRLRHRQVRIIRDYGMADRREAPQFYRPTRPSGA
jgi:heme-degrading monooxygenase HmoA